VPCGSGRRSGWSSTIRWCPVRSTIAEQWLGWWYSLIAPKWRSLAPGKNLEPAYDTLDPLGLAPYPELAAIAGRRGAEALAWQSARQNEWVRRHLPPSGTAGEVVREVERAAGRKVKLFVAEFVLIPVRDDVVRRIEDERHLVPEHLIDGPHWADWVRDLVTRIGL
jgi:hypothetical protein